MHISQAWILSVKFLDTTKLNVFPFSSVSGEYSLAQGAHAAEKVSVSILWTSFSSFNF